MTKEQLDALLAKFEADESLMKAIKQANSTQEIVEIAKSRGFDIELQDLYDNADKLTPGDLVSLELSPEELEAVAGGKKKKGKKGTDGNPWTTYEKRRCRVCDPSDGTDPTSNPLPKPEGDPPDTETPITL